MKISIQINAQSCIRCGHCVEVCPSQIFAQTGAKAEITLQREQSCILCGHCVAVCPTDSITHNAFSAERLHKFDYKALPTPEQVELLLAVRRSNRALSDKAVPQEALDRILAAADRAPTASNLRQLQYTLVTDPAMLREIIEFTLSTFERMLKRISNPLLKPLLHWFAAGMERYIPRFRKMRQDYEQKGIDPILRGARAVLFIHAPKANQFATEDANLAPVRRDKKGRLLQLLGIAPDRRICAIIAFGMPQFRFQKYIDREPAAVKKI